MSSRFASTLSGHVDRQLGAARAAFGRRVMSDREIEAYLAARDAVRRIKRASFAAPLGHRVPVREGHRSTYYRQFTTGPAAGSGVAEVRPKC